jgi:hypothetical protein
VPRTPREEREKTENEPRTTEDLPPSSFALFFSLSYLGVLGVLAVYFDSASK